MTQGIGSELAQELPALELLRIMETARQGDRRETILLHQSRGWFQVAGIGHEALAALGLAMAPGDWLFPYYRDRALVLSRGITNYEIALGFFGKRDSSSGGRQMPSHYSSAARRIFSVATPTGSSNLPAAGAAWAARIAGANEVVVCATGEASTRQGEYYEAIAFALQESLPLILVVEDNGYAISTPTARHNPYRLNVFDRAHVVDVDGRNPDEVFGKGSAAFARARNGEGPTVLWCHMDRLCSHTSSDDHRVYRPTEDIEAMLARDPIPHYAERLISAGALARADWEAMQTEIALEIEEDYARAERAADADPSTARNHMYAAPKPTVRPPVPLVSPTTMVSAINETLSAALETIPGTMMFGEDIADPKGGVFGFTKGLSTRFPGRVTNSPLAEATIVGTAVGLAAAGMRPIFEVQFIDFIGPALSQLMNQVATLRWRTCGDWSCPVTLLAPCGAYLPGGGPWHSETLEGIWAHLPGLRVCMPGTPADAAGMLWTAVNSDDPTLYLIPKHIFRKRVAVPELAPVPLGKATTVAAGTDVTLVTWGNGLEIAAEARSRAESEGISVEVIDLRWIAPCDYEAITSSVARTGRLVVLQEDRLTAGFGDTIVREMVSLPERWELFLSPPAVVARQDAYVPFVAHLEYAVLPDTAELMDAIRHTME